MQSMSLYVEKDTFVHRIDPISKIFYIIASIAISFILQTFTITIICLVINLILLLTGRVFKNVLPLIGYSSLVLVTIVIIQGLFNPGNKTALFELGPLTFYTEGLKFAALICLRVINILCAFSVLILTTRPSNLIEELIRKGVSPKIGYVLSSVLQIIPQMVSTMGKITDAQRARGMETEGNLFKRIKAFIPLIGPVVMSSLIQTRERAMALEVRGFSSPSKRTFFNQRHTHRYGIYIQALLILVTIAAVVWRIIE